MKHIGDITNNITIRLFSGVVSLPSHIYDWDIEVKFSREHIWFFLNLLSTFEPEPWEVSLLQKLKPMFLANSNLNEDTFKLSPNAIKFLLDIGKSAIETKEYDWSMYEIISTLEVVGGVRLKDAC